MRLLRVYVKFFQSPQLGNLLLPGFVSAAALAEGYFAHEAVKEQPAECRLDDFIGKKVRPVEFKDFCFVALLNMKQKECQAKFAQVPQKAFRCRPQMCAVYLPVHFGENAETSLLCRLLSLKLIEFCITRYMFWLKVLQYFFPSV